jgi:hypothetical protein
MGYKYLEQIYINSTQKKGPKGLHKLSSCFGVLKNPYTFMSFQNWVGNLHFQFLITFMFFVD